MQESEEQDTCRICGAPAEPDQPLFYPCKCSGTIRYIHQDCLTTWLSHSRKKTCDVCKHPYSFTKVYTPDMPARLPPVLLLRRLAQQLFFALLLGIRAIVVALVWLAVLPWITVWTWRMYFAMGDSTAWWISNRPRAEHEQAHTPFRLSFFPRMTIRAHPPSPDQSVLHWITSHPLYAALSADIFTGQIIALLIVLTFVAVFFLREWISQNARPGVWGDAGGEIEQQGVVPMPVAANALDQPPEQVPAIIPEVVQRPAPHVFFQQQPQQPVLHIPPETPQELAQEQHPHQSQVGVSKMTGRVPATKRTRTVRNGHRSGSYQKPRPKATHMDQDKGKQRDTYFDEDADGRRAHRRRRLHSTSEWGTRPIPDVPESAFDHDEPSSVHPIQGMYRSEPHTLWETARVDEDIGASGDYGIGPSRSFSGEVTGDGEFRFTFAAPSTRGPTASFDETGDPASPSSGSDQGSLVESPQEVDIPPQLSSFLIVPRLPVPSGSTPTTTRDSNLPTASPPRTPYYATYSPPEVFQPDGDSADANGNGDMDGDVGEGYRYYCRELQEGGDGENDMRGVRPDGTVATAGVRFYQRPDNDGGNWYEEDEEEEGDTIQRDFLLLDSGDETEEDGEVARHEEEDEDEDEDEDEAEMERPAFVEPQGDIQAEHDRHLREAQLLQPRHDALPNAGEVPPPQGAPAEAAAQADANDDMDVNVEDDMEGALEAIGMRGPLYGVVQNAALMIFVLDTAIGLGVWVPFTIGKSTALLALDPHRLLQILHFPIKAMRILTDPIVDFVMSLIARFVLPGIWWLTCVLVEASFDAWSYIVGNGSGQSTADTTLERIAQVYSRLQEVAEKPLDEIIKWSLNSAPAPSRDRDSLGNGWIQSTFVDLAESHLARLGQEAKLRAANLQATWTRLALGNGPVERTFAVALGYAVLALLLSLYLNLLTVGSFKSAGKAVRNAVRQQLLIVKVTTFIVIELVLFPFKCGVVLDMCTVWLFPEATLMSRTLFFVHAPLTATFYHWVAGTMFMYAFAILLSGCRSIVRPGAMWFIKDPQDPNSHPIRDILDRPTFTQFRKIMVSAVMYTVVVACVVASVGSLLLLGRKFVLPLRWKNREPLSDVPLDLILLHLLLPYTMHYFRPVRSIKKIAEHLWRVFAARLRLTSYMFGDRHPVEERSPKHWSWLWLIQRQNLEVDDPDYVRDGTFRRVPATDNLALPRDMRATARVTENGEPMDEEARALIAEQNAEAEKAKRLAKDDYTIVYIPPNFRRRIILFISIMWTIGSVLFGIVLAAPILLGRGVFRVLLDREVHDGYSLITGFYLFWACYVFGKAIDRMDKRRQRRGGEGPRADLLVYVFKRSLLWSAKALYMVLCLGLVIPLLIALVMELYLILPIRYGVNPDATPRIRIVDMWCLGILYSKIALYSTQLQPMSRVTAGVRNILNNGWTHPDPISATKEVIAPVTGALLILIIFPGAVFGVVHSVFHLPVDNRFLLLHVYPGLFACAGFYRIGVMYIGILSTWSQSVRDKEFLVEMRLRNLEPDKEKQKRERSAENTENGRQMVVEDETEG